MLRYVYTKRVWVFNKHDTSNAQFQALIESNIERRGDSFQGLDGLISNRISKTGVFFFCQTTDADCFTPCACVQVTRALMSTCTCTIFHC